MNERFTAIRRFNLWDGNVPAMGYVRNEYVEKITKYTGNRLVKVITGQQRSGKSYILHQIAGRFADSGVDVQRPVFP